MKEKKRQVALLKKRTIEIIGCIDSLLADRVCADIRYLSAVSIEPITLYIQSDGGDMRPALDVWSALRASQAPVIGVVQRFVASFAVLVLQACSERRMYPYAHLRVHSMTVSDFPVTDSDELVLAKLQVARREWEEILGLYATRMKRDIEEIRPLFVGNGGGRTYTVDRALREGLIDVIEKLQLGPVPP
ncbi:MAG: ATP-dependent Clp protease proteolytic subunit [bacterium]|nr:ATP-dependent Clp protease proteolytic subunit [bacterium]